MPFQWRNTIPNGGTGEEEAKEGGLADPMRMTRRVLSEFEPADTRPAVDDHGNPESCFFNCKDHPKPDFTKIKITTCMKLKVYFLSFFSRCISTPAHLVPAKTQIENGLCHLHRDFDPRNIVTLLK